MPKIINVLAFVIVFFVSIVFLEFFGINPFLDGIFSLPGFVVFVILFYSIAVMIKLE